MIQIDYEYMILIKVEIRMEASFCHGVMNSIKVC